MRIQCKEEGLCVSEELNSLQGLVNVLGKGLHTLVEGRILILLAHIQLPALSIPTLVVKQAIRAPVQVSVVSLIGGTVQPRVRTDLRAPYIVVVNIRKRCAALIGIVHLTDDILWLLHVAGNSVDVLIRGTRGVAVPRLLEKIEMSVSSEQGTQDVHVRSRHLPCTLQEIPQSLSNPERSNSGDIPCANRHCR